MIVQLPGIQPEIAMHRHARRRARVGAAGAGSVVPPAAAEHGDRQLVQPAARAQGGVLSRHIHPSWVTGYVIRGAWRYLEHDWVATEGSFVYEPPGEIHTLVVDEQVGATEMITFFNIHGAMVYVDDAGHTTGYEDVFTKIAMCRQHYEAVGLGGGYVDQFVR
jgi:2,4'-dihydroxyacetophenone dioxygenase